MSVELPGLELESLRAAYASGEWTPTRLVEALDEVISAAEPTRIWISRVSRERMLEYAREVEARGWEGQPLYGVPFAIKDNIDLAGMPTTAACPEFAYEPGESAFVVRRLMEAGAIPLGKTNLDQFATGLVGVRSPYGFPANAIDEKYIPGGSSSGSAVAVARGFASFALGTDTAGSGRVPAAFNGLVGLKPTRGLLSCRGVVPACRTLDCVSVFSLSAGDAGAVLDVAATFDRADAYARADPGLVEAAPLGETFTFGVPREDQLEFFGNGSARGCFAEGVARMESLGGKRVEIGFGPFLEAARLLYEGPWVAERYAAIEDILNEKPEILHSVTRGIIEGGGDARAVDAFRAAYRLQELKRVADEVWEAVDFVMTPTTGTVYTVAEVEAESVKLNSNLGYYTNFMNLLDYSALACPAGVMESGMPFGATLFAPAFHDGRLLDMAARFGGEKEVAAVPNEGWTKVVVCGAHMRGLPLNGQLMERGGRFVAATRTLPIYRLFALPASGELPPRPGLIREDGGGAAVAVEVWVLPTACFGDFVAQIPAPLGIGKVELEGGEVAPGFLCEGYAVEGAEEITSLGDWRSFVEGSQARGAIPRCNRD
ncbi:MAG: allophanate hydrolase [Verrucomicrobiota bacterium]